MCGRFSLTADLQELGERFGFDPGGLTHPPRYNAAPTQPVLAVMNGEERRAEHLRWGLIPSWARSASVGSRLINARAETAAELPSFRTAFSRRRCLVLADGFYEWRRVGEFQDPDADRDEVGGTLRLRRPLGHVAGPGGGGGPLLHHHHHRAE